MTTVRRVHCVRCHPDGGDIERDPFVAYSFVRQDDDGAEKYPICRVCGQQKEGRKLWRNGHSADGLEPA